MFINYRNTNVHSIPFVKSRAVTLKNKKTGKKRTVQQIEMNQSPNDIHRLMPGWNEFPKHVWDQNKDHPSIQKMIKDKTIEVLHEEVTVKLGKKSIKRVIGMDDEPINLRDFSETRATQLVKETLNRDILQRWLDEETRHKVKRALTKQIEPLLNSKQDNED